LSSLLLIPSRQLRFPLYPRRALRFLFCFEAPALLCLSAEDDALDVDAPVRRDGFGAELAICMREGDPGAREGVDAGVDAGLEG
tara:strand:+ start:265 stop:516 length:252 start_codon:yes stop_codon:yes gene_type:complete